MLLAFLAILVGLVILVWSSDLFVDGAAAIAYHAGISKLMVGLTIVAFGTSAPEILVSAFASYEGAIGLSVGNAIGSNITNIGLVLGLTAIFVSIPVHSLIARQDIPVYLLVIVLTGWILHDDSVSLLDALAAFSLLAVIAFLVIRYRSKMKDAVLIEEAEEEVEWKDTTNNKAILKFLVGLALLLVSSRILVWGAIEVAKHFGVDDVIIGLTIVAIGTSLPELAATLGSALKNHPDIAIGNVVGSNILNLLAVLPLPGVLHLGLLPEDVFQRDFLAMLLISLMLTVFVFLPRKALIINRVKGIVLLVSYTAYLSYLITVTI